MTSIVDIFSLIVVAAAIIIAWKDTASRKLIKQLFKSFT